MDWRNGRVTPECQSESWNYTRACPADLAQSVQGGSSWAVARTGLQTRPSDTEF